jgi:hypothetical protein
MTRKHYVAVAAAIRDARPPKTNVAAYVLWRQLVRDMVDIFKSDNSLFDRDRFNKACGVED